jgi:hypothetical protein
MDFQNVQWLDSNSSRSYPLVDGVSATSVEGFVLPQSLIVDLRLAAPVSLDATQFFVSQLAAYGTGLVITISVTGSGPVASVTVPLLGFTEFAVYTVAPLPGFDVGGTIVIGTAAAAIAAGSGVYNFLLAAAQILPTVIFPAVPAVTSITFVDAFGVSTKLTGAVVLQAGANATLSVSGQNIQFSMDSGVVLNDPCGADTGGTRRNPVRTIAGVAPDVSGNIDLIGTACLVISAGINGLQLADACAQPCCGSAELDQLAAGVSSLNQQLATAAAQVAALEAQLRIAQTYIGQ